MKKALCKPCAVALEAEGKEVKRAPGIHEKITCKQCGRRRYGRECEVTTKKEEESA